MATSAIANALSAQAIGEQPVVNHVVPPRDTQIISFRRLRGKSRHQDHVGLRLLLAPRTLGYEIREREREIHYVVNWASNLP